MKRKRIYIQTLFWSNLLFASLFSRDLMVWRKIIQSVDAVFYRLKIDALCDIGVFLV